ncbi:MAG: porin [Pirellulales bacterium]
MAWRRDRAPPWRLPLLALALAIAGTVVLADEPAEFGVPGDSSWAIASDAEAVVLGPAADELRSGALPPGDSPGANKGVPAGRRLRELLGTPSDDDRLINLRGRIDTDAIWSTQSPANLATYGDLGDVVGLRRARIGAFGNFSDHSRYLAEIDLASGNVVIRDLYYAFGQPQENGEFRGGHYREPFSLEGAISANSFAFMERSPINNLDPARNWGLGYFACDAEERATWALGFFRKGSDPSDLQGGDGSDSAVTMRGTVLPYYEDEGARLMHLGFALSSRVPDNGLVVINQRPASPLLDLGDSSASPFVPTLRYQATFQQLFNAQWAMAQGSFWAQAEWYGTLIDQSFGRGEVFLHGCYLDVGYFLTGEHRAYERRNGFFGFITVDRPVLRRFSSQTTPRPAGFGAWEVTARFAYLDFFDTDNPRGPQGQLEGVEMPQGTLGLNWYLADRCRLMFNYYYSTPREPNTGVSSASIYSMRLGVFW